MKVLRGIVLSLLISIILCTGTALAYEIDSSYYVPTLTKTAGETVRLVYPGPQYALEFKDVPTNVERYTVTSTDPSVVRINYYKISKETNSVIVYVVVEGSGKSTISLKEVGRNSLVTVEDLIPYEGIDYTAPDRIVLTLESGKNQYKITPELMPASSNADIFYEYFNNGVITVDEDGLITAIGEGECTIRPSACFYLNKSTQKLQCIYGEQLTVYVTKSMDDTQLINEVSKQDIKNAYDTYIKPSLDPTVTNSAFSYNTNKAYDSNSRLTESGYNTALGYVNFVRAIHNSPAVTLDPTLNAYSQAGVDFLEAHNLGISHTAANDSDDEAAKMGLSRSNLHSGGKSAIMSALSYFSDVSNMTAFSIGHRVNLLRRTLKKIGIGSASTASATYVWDNSVWDDPEDMTIMAYPAAGYSPVEIISESTGGVPLWNVDFSYMGALNEKNGKVTISEKNGKTVTFTKTNSPDSTGTWYQGTENILINPYVFTNSGNYSSLAGRTFTITIEGLDGPAFSNNKFSYTTTFISLKDEGFNPYYKKIEETPTITYETHIENIGWGNYGVNGTSSGSTGQSLRLEGIKINVSGAANLGLEYRTHVENIGWQDYVSTGQMAGTEGLALRLEGIQIRLTGSDASKYDVYYRVHAQDVGWMNWAKNDQMAGTAGFARRLEAIQIKIVPKGSAAPSVDPPNDTDAYFLSA